MIGFYGGAPGGNVTVEAEGSDRIPSTGAEVRAAEFGSAFFGSLGPKAVRGIAAGRIPVSTGDPMADFAAEQAREATPEPMLSAQDLYETKRAELVRQDVLARNGGDFGSGAVARFGAGALGALLDPINVASAFIPVVPAARVGVALAGAAGAVGRAGVRVGVGAIEGAVGQAALEPLQYALDQQEQNDWTMADALKRVAFGAVLGGGLHVVGGAVADRVTGRYANPITDLVERAGPVARQDGASGALAAVSEGRAVNVAPVFEMADARAAAGSLDRLTEDYAALRGQAETVPAARPDQVLEQLREQVPDFRPDIEPARADAPAAAFAERVTAPEPAPLADEAGVLPAAERVDPTAAPKAAVATGRATEGVDSAAQALPVQRPAADVVQAVRDDLWTKLRAGDTTEAGAPSSLLAEARANMDAGAIKSRPDFERFLDDYNPRRIAAAREAVAQRVRTVEADAMDRLRENAARPADDADPAAVRQAVEVAERAPKVEGRLDAQLAEVTKLADDLALRVDTEAKAGRLSPADAEAFAQARAGLDLAEGDARAYEAAAACLVTRG